jgi:hypothetical protein
MNKEYDFKLDVDDCIQVGDTRFFEIEASPEQVDRFIKDNELFKDAHSGCVCDCEVNYGGSCKNPKAYLSGGCK